MGLGLGVQSNHHAAPRGRTLCLAAGISFVPLIPGQLTCFPLHMTDSSQSFVCLFCCVLATPHGLRDLSSPTRDRTWALGSESPESYPLDHQGIPSRSSNCKFQGSPSLPGRPGWLVTLLLVQPGPATVSQARSCGPPCRGGGWTQGLQKFPLY